MLLFWVMSAFLVLPFGVRTHDEAGIAKVPGQADSAPANFRPRRIAKRATAALAAAVRAVLRQLRQRLDQRRTRLIGADRASLRSRSIAWASAT